MQSFLALTPAGAFSAASGHSTPGQAAGKTVAHSTALPARATQLAHPNPQVNEFVEKSLDLKKYWSMIHGGSSANETQLAALKALIFPEESTPQPSEEAPLKAQSAPSPEMPAKRSSVASSSISIRHAEVPHAPIPPTPAHSEEIVTADRASKTSLASSPLPKSHAPLTKEDLFHYVAFNTPPPASNPVVRWLKRLVALGAHSWNSKRQAKLGAYIMERKKLLNDALAQSTDISADSTLRKEERDKCVERFNHLFFGEKTYATLEKGVEKRWSAACDDIDAVRGKHQQEKARLQLKLQLADDTQKSAVEKELNDAHKKYEAKERGILDKVRRECHADLSLSMKLFDAATYYRIRGAIEDQFATDVERYDIASEPDPNVRRFLERRLETCTKYRGEQWEDGAPAPWGRSLGEVTLMDTAVASGANGTLNRYLGDNGEHILGKQGDLEKPLAMRYEAGTMRTLFNKAGGQWDPGIILPLGILSISGRETLLMEEIRKPGVDAQKALSRLKDDHDSKLISDTAFFGTLAFVGKRLLSVQDFLQRLDYAHNDLKPENILITPIGEVLVCDFGGSAPLGNHPGTLSAYYMAPESVKSRAEALQPNRKILPRTNPSTGKSEVFQVGSTLFDILKDKSVYRGDGSMRSIKKEKEKLPSTMVDFLHKLLKENPGKRLDVAGAQMHPFLNGTWDFSDAEARKTLRTTLIQMQNEEWNDEINDVEKRLAALDVVTIRINTLLAGAPNGGALQSSHLDDLNLHWRGLSSQLSRAEKIIKTLTQTIAQLSQNLQRVEEELHSADPLGKKASYLEKLKAELKTQWENAGQQRMRLVNVIPDARAARKITTEAIRKILDRQREKLVLKSAGLLKQEIIDRAALFLAEVQVKLAKRQSLDPDVKAELHYIWGELRIPPNLDTRSAANWTAVPAQTGRAFRAKLDTSDVTPRGRSSGFTPDRAWLSNEHAFCA